VELVRKGGRADRWIELFLFGLMVFAPLMRGGNRHAAIWVLELTCALVLALWWVSKHAEDEFPWRAGLESELRMAWWFLCLAAFVYLTPLPAWLWKWLPGHSGYFELLQAFSPEAAQAWRPVSLMPDATALTLLAAVPLLAMYLGGRYLRSAAIVVMIRLALLMGVCQALLGMLQLGSAFRMLYFSADFANAAIGTFANANHLANYLVMLFPLALTLAWKTQDGVRGLLYTLTVLILFIGVFATSSRAGVLTLVLVSLIWAHFKIKGVRKSKWRWSIWAAVAVVLAGAFWFLAQHGLLGKMGLTGMSGTASMRGGIYASTLAMAWQFFPLGVGPGAFAGVFHGFEPKHLYTVVDHAHNDYLQGLAEWGVVSIAVLVAMGVFVWRQAKRLRKQGTDVDAHDVSVGLRWTALMGVVVLGLHCTVEFPAHIPANAMLAAFLLGVFMRPRLIAQPRVKGGI
jgi:hypothetical protein